MEASGYTCCYQALCQNRYVLQLYQSLFDPLFLTGDWPKPPIVSSFPGLILMDIFLRGDPLCHTSNNVYIYQHCLKYKNYILYMFFSQNVYSYYLHFSVLNPENPALMKITGMIPIQLR